MRHLTDPVTGERVVLLGCRVGSDEVYRGYVDSVIRNAAHFHGVSEDEMTRRLQNSDSENPVTYQDELFWVE